MEHFVTLFDSLFLPQGIALHTSMQRHIENFNLWILCVDEKSYKVLTALNLPNVKLLQLTELETEELQRVKPTRSKGEYCWTLTAFAPRFVFEADPAVSRVTYLDADLWFRKNPNPIFQELNDSGKHVLITDHACAPEYDQTAKSGKYCVQFMIFTRDFGENVRKWWEERCIEWCYARSEDGKYGDQKYLDDWPTRFYYDVHVLQDKELALAPWNATRFPYSSSIFYHFQGLRIVNENEVNIGLYLLPAPLLREVYKAYLVDLKRAMVTLKSVGFTIIPQAKSISLIKRIENILRAIYPFLRTSLHTGKMKL